MLTPEPVRVGARFRLNSRFLGRSLPLEYEVVEFEAPTRVVLQADTALLRSTDTMTFTPDGTGTQVEYDARLDTKGVLRAADPLLALLFRRIGNRAENGLRARLNTVARP